MVSTNDIVVESAPIVNIPQEPIEGTLNGNNGAGCIIEDDFDKAQKKYQLGKKNLLLSKYDDAVNNIGDACKVYSTKFGEFAPECAEVYFYYGKALLELARVENTVLGNALNGVPEDTGPINDDSRYGNPDDVAAEEKEDIADKVIDAMCEDAAAPAAAATTTESTPVTTTETPAAAAVEPVVTPVVDASGAASAETETTPATTTTTTTEAKTDEAVVEGEEEEEGDDDEEDDGEDGEDGEEDLTKNNDETKNGVNGGNGDEADADDISNLQRSWEMFELAKLVFNKNFDNDLPYKTKRIAECLIKLGEISIEQELYEQAIIDIKESIRMQEEKQTNERDERMLAESYYQFGLAYQFSEQFQLAGEQYQKSINILQLRIDKLKGLIEQTSDDFEKQQFKDEITELETILPEMVSKLEEIKEQGEQSVKLIQEAKECFLNKVNNDETATTGTNGTTTEVKDITSLVKSKRKISSSQINIDGENGSEESAIKKTKVEEVESTTTTTTETETPTETTTTTTTTTETPIETDTVTTA